MINIMKQLITHIDESLHTELKIYCTMHKISLKDIIAKIVADFLTEGKKITIQIED